MPLQPSALARAWLAILLAVALAACDGPQSALAPAGRDAREIGDLFWLLAIGAGVIWVVVLTLLAYAVSKGSRRVHGKRTASIIVWAGGIVIPAVVLTALVVHALPLMPALRAGGADFSIEVSGEQYWWRVTYRDAHGQAVETANELRLPVGRSIEVLLTSPDVIHSFWVPALAGKMDAIPGRTNRLVLRPERIGRYRGVCAELCGESHAFMAFDVQVVEEAAFAAWLAQQARDAPDPVTLEERRGATLLHDTGCGACHAVRGTPAQGRIGPDLTHVGSRATIAAGHLPTNRGTLAGWIAASQDLKPGNKMPSFNVLSGRDLRALGTYLEALK